jgi:hypothetical protein
MLLVSAALPAAVVDTDAQLSKAYAGKIRPFFVKTCGKCDGKLPLGSSGIQIRIETELIIEGIRPTQIVRDHPAKWPKFRVPREEFLGDGNFSHEDRFPTPAVFPNY